MSTRALAPSRNAEQTWSVVVDAGELAPMTGRLRQAGEITLAPTPSALVFTGAGFEHSCPTINEPFPDYRTMLAGLAPVATRVVVPRDWLLGVVTDAGDATLHCAISTDSLTASTRNGAQPRRIAVHATGSGVALAFDPANLQPAIRSAVGPEIMLDISGPDEPVVVRSATAGDLTTLVMPTSTATDQEPRS